MIEENSNYEHPTHRNRLGRLRALRARARRPAHAPHVRAGQNHRGANLPKPDRHADLESATVAPVREGGAEADLSADGPAARELAHPVAERQPRCHRGGQAGAEHPEPGTAVKFLLYSLFGGLLMLVAVIALNVSSAHGGHPGTF